MTVTYIQYTYFSNHADFTTYFLKVQKMNTQYKIPAITTTQKQTSNEGVKK